MRFFAATDKHAYLFRLFKVFLFSGNFSGNSPVLFFSTLGEQKVLRRRVMTLQELFESNQQPEHGPLIGAQLCSSTNKG